MLVLDLHIVEELSLVQLHNVEDLLCLLELLSHLQVLHALTALQASLSLGNELPKDSHSFLAFAHGDEQEGV